MAASMTSASRPAGLNAPRQGRVDRGVLTGKPPPSSGRRYGLRHGHTWHGKAWRTQRPLAARSQAGRGRPAPAPCPPAGAPACPQAWPSRTQTCGTGAAKPPASGDGRAARWTARCKVARAAPAWPALPLQRSGVQQGRHAARTPTPPLPLSPANCTRLDRAGQPLTRRHTGAGLPPNTCLWFRHSFRMYRHRIRPSAVRPEMAMPM